MPTDTARIPADYRRLWRRAVGRELARSAGMLAMAVPGLVVGFRFTDGWASQWVATQVVVLAATVTVAAGEAARWLVGRMRGSPPPEPPAMVRAIVRGEAALVTPPHRAGGRVTGLVVGLVVVAVWLVVATAAIHAGVVAPDRAQALIPVAALVASPVVSLLSQRRGPRLALFPDRLEVRRGLGYYRVPWSAVALGGARDERAVVYLRRVGLTTRRGWVRRHPAYGVPVGPSAVPPGAVTNAIEQGRRTAAGPSRVTERPSR